jgi:hypothetical protein
VVVNEGGPGGGGELLVNLNGNDKNFKLKFKCIAAIACRNNFKSRRRHK